MKLKRKTKKPERTGTAAPRPEKRGAIFSDACTQRAIGCRFFRFGARRERRVPFIAERLAAHTPMTIRGAARVRPFLSPYTTKPAYGRRRASGYKRIGCFSSLKEIHMGDMQ
ncbi:hypothetical protein L0Z13_24960 [Burkholderia multivorans]|uniref:hypothetical protein n=1 Tax=Burkholderia multivorans TaxID=87883 RepID=UPI0011218527|nr:hypothetical protein [Burkholderia multivorans]MBU9493197.1 hypothetical protein [Burkholderia multivorans]MCO1438830.1 hypothetical protein [Burkholderia multivorans]MDN7508123.1 hypothetical protein [Burkholderia multivorans]UQN58735.1 hypothetical protein L0Y94_06550 [Burkholderia multivorans]UQN62850.1 hypothetical protein L0Y92_08480 [Burkholderia multivorans]